MEAILDKKSPKKKTARWQPRLFRLKDRRLIHFKKGVVDSRTALDSSAKYTLDLTHLTHLIIDKKTKNILIIYHPVIDLALRFKTNEQLVCWLKVFSSFTKNINENGPNIKTSIPSNYLFSIWHILQALYSHQNLQTIEGIFRKSSDKIEKNNMFNQLLLQTYDINTLLNYKNIHVLANVLTKLLTNLPSTIFKEKQIEILVTFFQKKRILKGIVEKQGKKHIDYDVAEINKNYIKKLKLSMETLYLSNKEDRNRYGLMTLIFHLLKQIIINESITKQTAESLSIVFAEIFESKIFLLKLKDPQKIHRSKYLIKALIYWAYDIFPEQQWCMNDIVITAKCEQLFIDQYNQYHKKKEKKHKKGKSGQWKDKYLLSKKQLSQKAVQLEQKQSEKALKLEQEENSQESAENSTKKKFVSHFKNPSLNNISPNDLNIINDNELKQQDQRRKTVDIQSDNNNNNNNNNINRERASTDIYNENKIDHIESDPDEKSETKKDNENENKNEKQNENSIQIVEKRNKIDDKIKDDLKLKMSQRMSYAELNSRGIVLDTKEMAQRQKHKREASDTIDKLLINRPTPNDLHSQNIINTTAALYYGADKNEIYCDNIDRKEFINKFAERPSYKQVSEAGIILDSTQTEQRQSHRRKASTTIDKLLVNRPTPSDLHSQNIINTTAALYYGADKNEIYCDNIDVEILDMKLARRPSYKQVNEAGIILDSTQTEQKRKHKRKASGTIDKLLQNRPSPSELHSHNIIDTNDALYYGVAKHQILDIENDRIDKEYFANKLAQRPSYKQVNDCGILLDSAQIEQREKHRRTASGTIDKLLQNRPTPSELHSHNIIDTTAALYYGAEKSEIYCDNMGINKKEMLDMKLSARPSYAEVSAAGILLDIKQREEKRKHKRKASDNIDKLLQNRPRTSDLYALNIMKDIWGTNDIDINKLENKLAQRPSISETIGRGILLYRTDLNINSDLQERHKELDKRKVSQKIEKFIMKRPSENELKKKSILITDKGIEQKRKHKRKRSQNLEIGLKNRMSFQEIKCDKKYVGNINNKNKNNDNDSPLDVYRYMVELFDMMYNVRTPCIDDTKIQQN